MQERHHRPYVIRAPLLQRLDDFGNSRGRDVVEGGGVFGRPVHFGCGRRLAHLLAACASTTASAVRSTIPRTVVVSGRMCAG